MGIFNCRQWILINVVNHKTKSEALKVLTELKTVLAEDRKPRKVPLSSFIKDYLEYVETNMSKSSHRSYRLALHHFKRIIGEIDIAKITPKHWDDFKTKRSKERRILRRKGLSDKEWQKVSDQQQIVSPHTVNVDLRHIKAALGIAAKWRLISRNPFEKMSLMAIPRTTPPFLTVEDAEHLISKIEDDWFRDFVIFALNTGMRRGELLSLRWCDIDELARVARITNRQDFTTKSGEERCISLNDAAISALKRCKKSKKTDLIFLDERSD